MDEAKPFNIPKRVVWKAFKRVKANRGAAGVDKQSIAGFEADLSNNLYKLWNRMCSGSYFPPPVRRVEIPKADGGMRPLGIPKVADRIAQEVARRYLEPRLEPVFHTNSYGYRPGRSAIDAVRTARQRCWRADWVLDIDVKGYFDSIDWELLLKAVRHHTDCPWVLLYIERWLRRRCRWRTAASCRGRRERRKVVSSVPCWRTCSCTTRSTCGWCGPIRTSRSNGTRTTSSVTACGVATRIGPRLIAERPTASWIGLSRKSGLKRFRALAMPLPT